MLHAFIYGIVLALGLIVPLGVQNIFLFNQGASQTSLWHAMPSVITAIICDSILIISAVLGVSAVVFAIPWFKILLLTFGFFFLLYMSFVTWFTRPKQLYQGKQALSARKQILFSLSVSLLNPHALLDTIGVIGTSSLQFSGYNKLIFAMTCIMVSVVWFFTLVTLGHTLHKLDERGTSLQIINKISAIAIGCVAIYIAWLLIHT